MKQPSSDPTHTSGTDQHSCSVPHTPCHPSLISVLLALLREGLSPRVSALAFSPLSELQTAETVPWRETWMLPSQV